MRTNDIQNVTKNLGTALAKNSPTILTGLGVAGLLTTTIMAVKATPKALQLIEQENEDREYENAKPMDTKEAFMLTWKCYLPATIMGVLTVGCMVSANSVNLKRNAALAGAYSLSEAALKEYRAKVAETIGAPKERKIRDEIAKDKIQKNPVKDTEIVLTGKGETLCYDALTGRYFKSDIEYIRKALNKLSRDLMSEMFITLNTVYYDLGLAETKIGDVIGWHIDDGLIEPAFSSHLTQNGTPCLVLDFTVDPRYMPNY